MKIARYILAIAVICLSLQSCSDYDKMLKSTDYDAKFTAAKQYYDEERYTRARQLFENLSLYYRGTEHAEDILWYYAMTQLKSGMYYSAGYQFNLYSRRYPYSERAEEAAFLSAYCNYMESPSYTLDQTMTKNAIAELEQFSQRYPQSIHMPEVNNYLDELNNKLMMKEYEIAYGYYFTESYRAAVVSLNQFLSNYPDSPKREEAMFYIIKSSYEYAINSREDKQKERLQQTVNHFDKFATTFRNSKFLSESQDIYTKCKALLAEM